MNLEDFTKLVYEMRKHQKEYFKTRNVNILMICKQLEKNTDIEIEKIKTDLSKNKLTNEYKQNQLF